MKKKQHRSISLSTQISIGYVCLLVITIGISAVLYFREAGRLHEQNENVSMNRELLTYQAEFESYIDRVDECSKMLCNSDALQNALLDASKFISEEPVDSLDDTLIRQLTESEMVSSVYVFDTRGNMYEASTDYNRTPAIKDIWSAPWYSQVFDKAGGYILKMNSGGFFEEGEQDYISLIRSVRELGSDNLIGTLIVNVSLGSLRREVKENADEMNMSVVVCDEYTNVAFSIGNIENAPIRQYLRNYIIEGRNYQTYQSKSSVIYKTCCKEIAKENWWIVGIVKKNTYQTMARQFGGIAFFVLLIDIFIVLIGVLVYKNLLFKILDPLLDSMRKIPEGQLNYVKPIDINKELYELQVDYNQMVSQMHDLFQRIEDEQAAKRKYELEVLNAQVKPHFLYNSLDSIKALILTKRDTEAFQMLQALGKYYRTSLHKGNEVISLSEEIEIARNYLIIQKYRYEDVFSVQYDLDESVNGYKVLKLIVQPFVENAIYHGLKVKRDGGTIKLCTADKGDYVQIQIEDNGVGMSQEKITRVLSEDDSQEKTSFGMRGTIERIHLHYKLENLVLVESKENKGTRISIRIPKTDIVAEEDKNGAEKMEGINRR